MVSTYVSAIIRQLIASQVSYRIQNVARLTVAQQVDRNLLTTDGPSFCHSCGTPYPWMDDKLRTAKDLLFHDDKLT